MPRTFVPKRVEVISDDREQWGKLISQEFNPRAVAYVSTPVSLPNECNGTAEISSEVPTRLDVSVKMETAGLLVLTDLWDVGWHAYLNGNEVPILRANYAVRGVVVPAGESTIVFRYESGSLALGIKFAIGAAIVLLGSVGFSIFRRRAPEPVLDLGIIAPA